MIIQTMMDGRITGIQSLFLQLITMVNSHTIPNPEQIFSLLPIRMVGSPSTREFPQLTLLDLPDILMGITQAILGGPPVLLR